MSAADTTPITWPLQSNFAAMPEDFYARTTPSPVTAPQLLLLNESLAPSLGLDATMLRGEAGLAVLAGNRVPDRAEPIAMAYAGHQFGNFVPSLGDGRAILLGELPGPEGELVDLQLKGAGRTPFSRGGDGRAALGPVLREFIVSEAMHALGIPSTRALAAVLSGEPVMRQSAERGAVLTRVARSHIRVGTFEYFARRGQHAQVRQLADYVIARHFPALREAENPYLALLDEVASRQAKLIVRWLGVGFIHGVMNTDNCSITGDTIDYGPCAFMDSFHPGTVYSAIDRGGRYAYDQQATIGLWNLARLAECLLPLLADDEQTALDQAHATLDRYRKHFALAYRQHFAGKLGLKDPSEQDDALIRDFLELLKSARADFTNSFRSLSLVASTGEVAQVFIDEVGQSQQVEQWLARWRQRLAEQNESDADRQARMDAINPAFIPRNHQIQQALEAAETDLDLQPVEKLRNVLARPYTDQPQAADFARPPRADEVVQQTFCGT